VPELVQRAGRGAGIADRSFMGTWNHD
jgi:hypothetical protein